MRLQELVDPIVNGLLVSLEVLDACCATFWGVACGGQVQHHWLYVWLPQGFPEFLDTVGHQARHFVGSALGHQVVMLFQVKAKFFGVLAFPLIQ